MTDITPQERDIPVTFNGEVVGRAVQDLEQPELVEVYLNPESPAESLLKAFRSDISGISIYAKRTPTPDNPNNYEVKDATLL